MKQQGDISLPVRCQNCGRVFHLYLTQLDLVPEGWIVAGDCPGCGALNCWRKKGGQVVYTGPVAYVGPMFVDLRGKHGIMPIP